MKRILSAAAFGALVGMLFMYLAVSVLHQYSRM